VTLRALGAINTAVKPLGVFNTAVTRDRMEFLSRGGGGTSPQLEGPIPKKKIQEKKITKEEVVWVKVASSPTASRARAMY